MTEQIIGNECAWYGCKSTKTTWKDWTDSIRVRTCKKHEKELKRKFLK